MKIELNAFRHTTISTKYLFELDIQNTPTASIFIHPLYSSRLPDWLCESRASPHWLTNVRGFSEAISTLRLIAIIAVFARRRRVLDTAFHFNHIRACRDGEHLANM